MKFFFVIYFLFKNLSFCIVFETNFIIIFFIFKVTVIPECESIFVSLFFLCKEKKVLN